MIKIMMLLLLLALSFPFWLTPSYIKTSETILTNIGAVIGSLFVIALLLERFLDVFLTTWRASESEKLHLEIKKLELEITSVKTDVNNDITTSQNLKDLNDKLNVKKRLILDYKAKTRVIALWSGLILGVVVSAIGFRVLNSLIDQEVLNQASKLQILVFNFVDVFLTGGLLAGGSDGLHKLMEVYRSFTESTAIRISGSGT